MTQKKFMRNYKLTIWPLDAGDPIVIMMPTTININCRRALLDGQSGLIIDVYNLSELTRKRIYQDPAVPGTYFNAVTPSGTPPLYANISLEAGYGTQLHRIFYGHMGWAESYRSGTNIITHIEANSVLPDIVGSQLQVTLPAGTTAQQILLYLVNQFPTLKLGAIGNFPMVFNKPVTLNGIAWTLIKLYSAPGTAFIDNGKIYILNNNEVTGGIFVINDSSGILETPRRSGFMLIVNTLLETGVELVGQMVQIKSTVNNFYNGIYKVLMVEHRGMISGAVCGKMVSTFYLQAAGWFNGPTGSITPGQGFTIVPLAGSVAA